MANSTKITLKIIPFKYPSGQVAHRVTGMLHGRRFQKNFPTYREAGVFMDGLKANAVQGESSRPRLANTTIKEDDDLREAEIALSRLRIKLPEGSLVTAVDYYLANAGQVILDANARQILDKFIEHRLKRGNQKKTVSVSDAVLGNFLASEAITRVSEITRAKAENFIFDTSVSARTRRDRRDQMYNWAEYLVQQQYLSWNFVTKIDRPKVTHEGKVTTLTVDQVLKLLQTAATEPVGRRKVLGAMLPYFAVCALSGVRPDEAKRLRPDWAWFSKENALITGFRAKTRNRSRTVAVHPELVEILEYCRIQGFSPSGFSVKAFNRIREKAAVFDVWDNDILRHTFASHHYAWKKDMGWLEKNMGNSEEVLKQSYLDQTIVEAAGQGLLAISLRDILPKP
jgi:integrase